MGHGYIRAPITSRVIDAQGYAIQYFMRVTPRCRITLRKVNTHERAEESQVIEQLLAQGYHIG